MQKLLSETLYRETYDPDSNFFGCNGVLRTYIPLILPIMRINLFIVVSLLLGAASCNLETVYNETELTGRWKWLESTGGFAGTVNNPEKAGYDEIIEFSPGSLFKVFRNDSLTVRSSYYIRPGWSVTTGDSSLLLAYDYNNIRQSYFIRSDTLILRDECYDCFTSTYIRIK